MQINLTSDSPLQDGFQADLLPVMPTALTLMRRDQFIDLWHFDDEERERELRKVGLVG